jgi:hypothetical protein
MSKKPPLTVVSTAIDLASLEGKCGTCKYPDMGQDGRAFCRRYPATLVQNNGQVQALYPIVDLAKDWCGCWAALKPLN